MRHSRRWRRAAQRAEVDVHAIKIAGQVVLSFLSFDGPRGSPQMENSQRFHLPHSQDAGIGHE
jgi:hypothetical protein